MMLAVAALKGSEVQCPSCGKRVSESANFCKYCGSKMRETCIYCWVKRMDNYNCGESSCPAYGLIMLERSKSK